MQEPFFITFVNFIRAVEPRLEVDLVKPVAEQIALHKKYCVPATWLLQYDALVSGPYADMLKQLDSSHEVGVWLETVQPLVEKAGIKWRGLYPWDWHSNVGFTPGYTPEERERMIDVLMTDFKSVFGRYPSTVGSWIFDARSLEYMRGKYGVSAACNCKDQYGTDGYTLWGGYWNQAYYPSKVNSFMPAQNAEAQIDLPVFRMLGSDPVDQYDSGLNPGGNCTEVLAQGVVSLEPVYPEGGGSAKWVRWFLRSLLEHPSLAFQYAQAGQENSFGWDGMDRGYRDQIAYFSKVAANNESLKLVTMSEAAGWFRGKFKVTPPTSVGASGDSHASGRESYWYNSRFYRVNFLRDSNTFRIRDIHKFDEKYRERYLTSVCTTQASTFDTLPVAEGFLWSDKGVPSGFSLIADNGKRTILCDRITAREAGPGILELSFLGDGVRFTVKCHENGFSITSGFIGWSVRMTWAANSAVPFKSVSRDTLKCSHEGFDYQVRCLSGKYDFRPGNNSLDITPVNDAIELNFGI